MLAAERGSLITDIKLRDYLFGENSLFRHYQNLFLQQYGKELTGRVVELGCEKKYRHSRYFPNASEVICTNIDREYDEYLDITDMPFEDGSQDAYVCISVLEHVPEVGKALSEIDRTLKVGGKLLMTVPFAYPRHDVKDYWRLSESAYEDFLHDYEVKAFVHLGGRISTIVDVFQRPKQKVNKRYAVYKIFGLLVVLALKHFDTLDDFPLGYGVYAVKGRGEGEGWGMRKQWQRHG